MLRSRLAACFFQPLQGIGVLFSTPDGLVGAEDEVVDDDTIDEVSLLPIAYVFVARW